MGFGTNGPCAARFSPVGTKADLVARLQLIDPDGKWSMKLIEEEKQPFDSSGREITFANQDETLLHPSEETMKELDFIRRERDLVKRELELTHRENEILRGALQPNIFTHNRLNVSVKTIGDLLAEFDGTDYAYPIWEKQVRLG